MESKSELIGKLRSVTGAGQGIGLATMKRLLEDGFTSSWSTGMPSRLPGTPSVEDGQ